MKNGFDLIGKKQGAKKRKKREPKNLKTGFDLTGNNEEEGEPKKRNQDLINWKKRKKEEEEGAAKENPDLI